MIIKPIKTRVFQEGEDLLAFIINYFKKIPEKSVVVITSKIVALAEKRTAKIVGQSKEKLIRAESDFAMRTKHTWLTVKNGTIMTSAGIDESNANGKFILLPQDSFKSARFFRDKLRRKYNIKHLGVIVTDSRTIPLRAGASGMALGYAGFRGIKSYRGKPDIFGRKFKFEHADIANSLATVAVLAMGEGNEQQPLAIIKKAPIEFSDKINRKELQIDLKEDMYQPLFAKLAKSY